MSGFLKLLIYIYTDKKKKKKKKFEESWQLPPERGLVREQRGEEDCSVYPDII